MERRDQSGIKDNKKDEVAQEIVPFVAKMSNNRFTKNERLKSRKEIGRLFQEGNNLGAYPLRLFFLFEKEGSGIPQVAFSVPKRLFKKAVHRNRIKRQMREAYRLKRSIWLEKLPPGQVTAIWVYTGREAVSYAEIEGAVQALLHRSARKLKKTNQPNPPQQASSTQNDKSNN